MHTSNAEVRNTTYVYNEGKINCRRDIFLFPTKENLKEKRSEKIFETPFRRLISLPRYKVIPSSLCYDFTFLRNGKRIYDSNAFTLFWNRIRSDRASYHWKCGINVISAYKPL